MRSSVGKSKISDLIFDKYDQDRSGKWDRREMHFFCYDNGGFALTQAELSKVCVPSLEHVFSYSSPWLATLTDIPTQVLTDAGIEEGSQIDRDQFKAWFSKPDRWEGINIPELTLKVRHMGCVSLHFFINRYTFLCMFVIIEH